MMDWKSETGQYLSRLENLMSLISSPPPHPSNIPFPPLEQHPTELQSTLFRAVASYKIGVLIRAHETTEAILCLWREGYLAQAASLSRLLLELWGVCNYLTQSISSYKVHQDLYKLREVVNKVFEGVRSEVLMPWGMPALAQPIHVLDTIRTLKGIYPEAVEAYDVLCESAHPNQPRYFEWWCLGKMGDNWTNETVQKRGHALLERTVSNLERCVSGIVDKANEGLTLCGELYKF